MFFGRCAPGQRLRLKSGPCVDTKSVRFGRTELLFVFRVANRESYNLGMVSGPVLLKINGTRRIVILLGFNKNKKKRSKNENN